MACCFAWLKLTSARERHRPRDAGSMAALCSVWDSTADGEALPLREPITPFGLNDSMFRLAVGMQRWEYQRFEFSHKLQAASRNYGRVDAMADLEAGCHVAVKKMPNWWIRSGPEQFWHRHPRELEQPWCDLGMVRELNRRDFPFSCKLMGVFADRSNTYVVTSLAIGGDLHLWTNSLPADPLKRERMVLPVAVQLCSAVALLHDIGVAHRDLSLENVLLTSDGSDPDAPVDVKLIDFSMSAPGRIQGNFSLQAVAGKRSYCAPEVHSAGPFDAFLADAFSIGVILYCMTMWDYPWPSTAPGASASLENARKVGMTAHLAPRRDMGASEELLELLAGLMEIEPSRRMCLGETCMLEDMLEEGRLSAPESSWLRDAFDSARDRDADACDLGEDGECAHDSPPSTRSTLTSLEWTTSPYDMDDSASDGAAS